MARKAESPRFPQLTKRQQACIALTLALGAGTACQMLPTEAQATQPLFADTPITETTATPEEQEFSTPVPASPETAPQPFEIVTPAGITVEIAKNPGVEINNQEALDTLLYYIFSATDPLKTPPGEVTTEMIKEFMEANPTVDMHVMKRMPGGIIPSSTGLLDDVQFPKVEGVRTDRIVINLFDPLQGDILPSGMVSHFRESAEGGYMTFAEEDQDGNKTLHISIIARSNPFSQSYVDNLPEDRDNNRNFLAERLNKKLAEFVLYLTGTGGANLVEREIDGQTYFFVRMSGDYSITRRGVFSDYFNNQPSVFSGIPD